MIEKDQVTGISQIIPTRDDLTHDRDVCRTCSSFFVIRGKLGGMIITVDVFEEGFWETRIN